MKDTGRLSDVKNYLFPTNQTGNDISRPRIGSGDIKKNLTQYIVPVQLQRLRHDVKMYRDAIIEAELAYYPQRVKMQRMFQDTILNGHVFACLERRKSLTLQRDFIICDQKGVPSDDLKLLFRDSSATIDSNDKTSHWFDTFMRHTLEAVDNGYSLISLGDVINDAYPEISIIKRWNVSPDRLNVTSYVYSLSGAKFLEDPYRDWHVYVPIPSELGVSPCGYGLLYKIAIYEIYQRNTIAYNMDFNEVFNQPYRIGKTSKTQGIERDAFEDALKNMGQMAYILLDEATDSIEFKESANVAASYQSYGKFQERMDKIISKNILGHADALDSVPGKLGNQGGEENPVIQAMDAIQSQDGILVQNVVNSKLIPRMRKHGFKIPLNYHFEFLNDKEQQEIRTKEDNSNSVTADIALKMKNAGLQIDDKYFTERTGIPCKVIEAPAPPAQEEDPNKKLQPDKTTVE